MKKIERIKKDCKNHGISYDIFMYNCGFSLDSLRYVNGKLYGTHRFFGAKPSFAKEFRKEIIFEDCI